MDRNDALKYLDGDMSVITGEPQTPPETEVVNPDSTSTPSVTTSTEETVEHETTENQNGGSGSEEVNTAGSKPEDKKNTPPPNDKKEHLPYDDPRSDRERRANKSFIKQKHKLKAKDDEIASLKSRLAKYEAVTAEDLGNDPEKIADLRTDKRMLKHDIDRLTAEREEIANEAAQEEADDVHTQRVNACFSDDKEKEHYYGLLERNREAFIGFLAKTDPDNSILNYLDDCSNSPLLVRAMLSQPKLVIDIVKKRNPINKVMDLRALENRILLDRKVRSKPGFQKSGSPANKLPSTGKQVGSGGANSSPTVRNKQYWEDYLTTHG